MFRVRIVSLVLCVACLMGLTTVAMAAQVDCDATYCFSHQDFSGEEELVRGICITGLPDPKTGTVMLGSRVLCQGDILSADALAQMTFVPLRTEEDAQAQVTYLPIYDNRVEQAAVMTISIRGKEDKIPVAEDSAAETYKNLPVEGKLKVSDPEEQELTYSLIRNPKRGQVQLRADGTFLYTPKKNKVGVDSFTYTATDPAGKVSREATVTVQILKPTDSRQYTDTVGRDCRFAAEWMRNCGLFVGETINGENCFQPEKTVSRGEFVAMVVKMLELPACEEYEGVPADAPAWLRPYLAAALRSGIGVEGNYEEPITAAEAVLILQVAMDDAAPTGVLNQDAPMTRSQTAMLLYEANCNQ